jgi:hypothetical protein
VSLGQHILDVQSEGEGPDPWVATCAAIARALAVHADGGHSRELRVLIADCRDGAAPVAVFDVLEAAWHAGKLCGDPGQLRAVRLVVRELPGEGPAARAAVNAFWDRDPDQSLRGDPSDSRAPWDWTVDFVETLPEAGATDWKISSPQVPSARARTRGDSRVARMARASAGATSRVATYFLERFFRTPHFKANEWAIVSRLLAGQTALACPSAAGEAGIGYLLPALLLPGMTVVAASAETIALRERQLRDVCIEPDFVTFATPEMLQDQKAVQALRHAIRKGPGGLSLLVVEEAERGTTWSDAFQPSHANIPAAFRDLGEAPLLVLPSAQALGSESPETVFGALAVLYGLPEVSPVGETVARPCAIPKDRDARESLAVIRDRIAAAGGAAGLAGLEAQFPGVRQEWLWSKDLLGRLSSQLERGGFARLPAQVDDVAHWDAGADRTGRFRSHLGRLHGLGFLTGFGENATDFFAKHLVVSPGGLTPYLDALHGRALDLLKGDLPKALRDLGPADLCAELVERVLLLSPAEGRLTARFFEQYIQGGLASDQPIVIGKEPAREDLPLVPAEPLLFRLKRLGVVREYFAEAGVAQKWSVAIRRFEREAFDTVLRTELEGMLLDPAAAEARLVKFRAAVLPEAPAPQAILAGLEAWLTVYYDVHVRRRYLAILASAGEAGPPADSGEDRPAIVTLSAAAWLGLQESRERERLDPLLMAPLDATAIRDVVAWFAARSRTSALRALAARQSKASDQMVPARVLEGCASERLGDAAGACNAFAAAVHLAAGAGDLTHLRTVLDLAGPAVRLEVCRREEAALLGTLGLRELRRWRHDASRALGHGQAAAIELLAEIRPISAAWRSSQRDLDAIGDLATAIMALAAR